MCHGRKCLTTHACTCALMDAACYECKRNVTDQGKQLWMQIISNVIVTVINLFRIIRSSFFIRGLEYVGRIDTLPLILRGFYQTCET